MIIAFCSYVLQFFHYTRDESELQRKHGSGILKKTLLIIQRKTLLIRRENMGNKKQESGKKKKPPGIRILKWIGVILLIIVLAVAGLFAFLTITEYKPEDVQTLDIEPSEEDPGDAAQKNTYTVVSWNTGYGALGDNADFFMDGGTHVKTADKDRVLQNVGDMSGALKEIDPDFIFLQEVDVDSHRSSYVDESGMFAEAFPEMDSTFATNYRVAFIPYPVPPIGSVESGIMTLSDCRIREAERVALPCPFSWPVRLGNLKRCLLVSRIRLDGEEDKELVLVNLHLEAYDSGEGKIEQTKLLAQILNEEREKGNYVIAGGDFNQAFSEEEQSLYQIPGDLWRPGLLDADVFGEGWQLLTDATVPTCRSLDKPLEGADSEYFQYYVIDGFIVSDNVKVESLETQSLHFTATDHNPVVLKFTLK